MFDLTGKRALVTGSSQGIGYAIAKALSEHGAAVYVHGSNEQKCKDAAKTIPNATPVCQDLSDPSAAKKLFELTGEVDILIANASVQYRNSFFTITSEEFEKQVAVNFRSTFEMFRIYGEGMKNKGWGRLISIGSVQQYKPHRDMTVYAATKAAVMNMVTNLAKQLAPYGITVNNIAPGVIATPRNYEALADKAYEKQVLLGIPAGYAGQAEDCAGGALLLASDAGRYINGIDLIIDGGMHL